MALPASDGFSQTSGSTQALATYSASWTILEGSFNVPSGANQAAAGTLNYNTAYWNADVFDADHESEVEITATMLADGTFGGPAVRCQAGPTAYHCETQGSDLYFSKVLPGPTQSTLAGPYSVTFVATDKLRLKVTDDGSTVTLRAYKNGVQVAVDVTDSTSPILTAGAAGIFCYDFNGAGNCRITNWIGENTNSGIVVGLMGQACL